jgi:hypothetical protein
MIQEEFGVVRVAQITLQGLAMAMSEEDQKPGRPHSIHCAYVCLEVAPAELFDDCGPQKKNNSRSAVCEAKPRTLWSE